MAVENEVKVCVDSFSDVRKRLVRIKAKHVLTVRERNILYDTGAGELRREDMGLRLRDEVGADDMSFRRVTLTVKGPTMKGVMKRRGEFEVRASCFKGAHELLCAIGFHKALVYEKVREMWALGKTEVCLDTLPFGLYVEIEGEEKDVFSTAKGMGFVRAQFITLNYFDLARKAGVRGDILFDSAAGGV
ncbi:MAG: hypothetical protein DRN71_04885 [Candidatus Nanohalarchaeota archaeon]|nr:MAG: hypothetical protein DRN71_04885 [Candidatus Nanohaloarchaeota archaeon]